METIKKKKVIGIAVAVLAIVAFAVGFFGSNGNKPNADIDAASVVDENPPAELKGNKAANNSSANAVFIGEEQAKAIALEHAQVDKDKVVFEKVISHIDDGILEYEVDFRADGVEYDYEIDAKSGRILDFDREAADVQRPAESKPASSEKSEYISAERAKEIALEHAKISGAPAYIRAEFDKDRNPHYDVDFVYDGFEYDYEIDAENGKVLEFDKEFDD